MRYMFKNHASAFFSLSLLMAATALQANAWTLFGSREDALDDQLRAGDKLMLKADSAYEAGKLSRAEGYYMRAMRKYESIHNADPDFMDGIAAIRIAYCARQYTNALDAASATTARNDESASTPPITIRKIVEEEDDADEEADDAGAREDDAEGADAAMPAEKEAETDMESDGGGKAAAAPPSRPAYDPRNFSHDFAEARMLLEEGNYAEAASVLIPLLRHDPANRQVRLMISIVRTRQGRYDEAIAALEDLRGIREDLPILLALSGAYMGASRYHDALLALDHAIKLNPADPNAFLNLAWLTLVMPSDSDTLKNAEIYYRQAIRRGAARDRSIEARIGLRKW